MAPMGAEEGLEGGVEDGVADADADADTAVDDTAATNADGADDAADDLLLVDDAVDAATPHVSTLRYAMILPPQTITTYLHPHAPSAD